MAKIGLLLLNSLNIQTSPKSTINILNKGEFSNQSPGRFVVGVGLASSSNWMGN